MEFQKGLTLQMTISLIIALDCGIKSLDHVEQNSILSSVITIDLEKLAEAIAV
jgi:single-stranded DNA-specific DHH superfamily exonuclease